MNVYDFDGTIFHPDSSYAFFLFCLKHYPREVMQKSGQKIKAVFSYFSGGRADAAPLKESLFSFLAYLPETKAAVDAFWKENEKGFAEWYLKQKKPDDLIISASPDFLLRPVCEKLDVSLIATPMDPSTGNILGLNCHDKEKLRRFRTEYPDVAIDNFYSDSLSDAPLAEIAKHPFLVKKHGLIPWPEE